MSCSHSGKSKFDCLEKMLFGLNALLRTLKPSRERTVSAGLMSGYLVVFVFAFSGCIYDFFLLQIKDVLILKLH